jgi:hypothetical protein
MIFAEKEITRVTTGDYEWSVELVQAIHTKILETTNK